MILLSHLLLFSFVSQSDAFAFQYSSIQRNTRTVTDTNNAGPINAHQCHHQYQYLHHGTDMKLHASADDDFDFDPLRSPHDYPNGTGDVNDSSSSSNDNEEDWSPMKMRSVKKDFEGSARRDYGVSRSTFTRDWSAVSATSNSNTVHNNSSSNSSSSSSSNNNESTPTETQNIAVADAFDPLLSPHSYSKGTNAGPQTPSASSSTSSKQETIGVLLIDHGSKRSSSNQRLETLANKYAQSSPSHYTIKAAHMEIASPSIEDSLREFCHENVQTVVCHPYFLSPGRHVLEDIPELIEEAIQVMKMEGYHDLEVITTEPVGSNLDRMVGLIGTMVDEALGVDVGQGQGQGRGQEEVYDGFVRDKGGELGGFFGEVKRMMDEQL